MRNEEQENMMIIETEEGRKEKQIPFEMDINIIRIKLSHQFIVTDHSHSFSIHSTAAQIRTRMPI